MSLFKKKPSFDEIIGAIDTLSEDERSKLKEKLSPVAESAPEQPTEQPEEQPATRMKRQVRKMIPQRMPRTPQRAAMRMRTSLMRQKSLPPHVQRKIPSLLMRASPKTKRPRLWQWRQDFPLWKNASKRSPSVMTHSCNLSKASPLETSLRSRARAQEMKLTRTAV